MYYLEIILLFSENYVKSFRIKHMKFFNEGDKIARSVVDSNNTPNWRITTNSRDFKNLLLWGVAQFFSEAPEATEPDQTGRLEGRQEDLFIRFPFTPPLSHTSSLFLIVLHPPMWRTRPVVGR